MVAIDGGGLAWHHRLRSCDDGAPNAQSYRRRFPSLALCKSPPKYTHTGERESGVSCKRCKIDHNPRPQKNKINKINASSEFPFIPVLYFLINRPKVAFWHTNKYSSGSVTSDQWIITRHTNSPGSVTSDHWIITLPDTLIHWVQSFQTS